MQVQVLRENLSKAVSFASRFSSIKAQLPVLANILLSVKGSKLSISATNLEISFATSIGAKTEKEGEITIPARVITELISNLKTETVEIISENERVTIKSHGFDSSISGMNSSDFPLLPKKAGNKNKIQIGKEEFLAALPQVSFATSMDETRPQLSGVLFLFQKEEIVLVATDGFRLSQKRIPFESKEEVKIQKVILPKTALIELPRLSQDAESVVFSFNDEENQVVFELGETVLSTRTIEGDYPDFERIIPKSSEVKIRLDKEEFLRAVKLSGIFARDSANITKINVRKNSIDVFAESQVFGNQKTTLDAFVEGQEGLEVAFNYRFLEEFLNAVNGEEVMIELSNPSSPGVFTDPKDETLLHLIMPVRIQG